MKTALLIIDLQNDFLLGGALPIKEGSDIIPIVNDLLHHHFDLFIATKDWHPKDHGSFAAQYGKIPGERVILGGVEQLLWPTHCVQNSPGADFAPGWDTDKVDKIFYKGTDKTIDSYSAFFDNGHRKSTGLAQFLQNEGVRDLYIAGLATDYCVKYSVLDAKKLGFEVFLFTNACRGVDLSPHDSAEALIEMKQAGAQLINSKELKS